MLTRVKPIDFVKSLDSGRTRPVILNCEKPNDDIVEVIAKFSDYCDEGVSNLAREVIAACLAGDLGLPISEPFLIEIDDEWIGVIPDAERRARVAASSRIAFGSKYAGAQFSLWNLGSVILNEMVQSAGAIFVYDGIIQNIDRHEGNPNCLVRGDAIRIFDHELAFTHGMVLGWVAPWRLGGLRYMEQPRPHIFRSKLRGRDIDFGLIRHAWAGLSDARVDGYATQIPPEWAAAAPAVTAAVKLIKEARDNIDACLAEAGRVLT